MNIRTAAPGEAYELTCLALRSKANWGYDQEFMESCYPALTVSPEYISQNIVVVMEEHGKVVGFYALELKGSWAELGFLFVEPGFWGKGVGKRLLSDALKQAHALGCDSLAIESDPNAEGFYVKCGARKVGVVNSPIVPGRQLPLLEIDVVSGI